MTDEEIAARVADKLTRWVRPGMKFMAGDGERVVVCDLGYSGFDGWWVTISATFPASGPDLGLIYWTTDNILARLID